MATLRVISKVAVDLFERSNASIEVTSGKNKIRISRKEYEQLIDNKIAQQNQVVQVINNISTNINIDNKTIIKQILDDVKSKESDTERINEAEEKLNFLLKEVQKRNPKWENIKAILKWALDFGKDVFIQLIPILLKMYRNL